MAVGLVVALATMEFPLLQFAITVDTVGLAATDMVATAEAFGQDVAAEAFIQAGKRPVQKAC